MRAFLSLFLSLIFLGSFAQNEHNRGYKVLIGDRCPPFELEIMNGEVLTTSSLKGKVVVLQFTASWCGVCRKEMPHLEKEVWLPFKKDDFVLIGIDLKEDKETVQAFIEKIGVSYPIGLDTDGSILEKFTLPNAGVTRNVVLNKEGEIIFLTRLFEEKEFNEMIDIIEQELAD